VRVETTFRCAFRIEIVSVGTGGTSLDSVQIGLLCNGPIDNGLAFVSEKEIKKISKTRGLKDMTSK
jgi:hypothetical protein